jgi:hypothetical protein
VSAPDDLELDEDLDIDPSKWDRARYWRSRVWVRYSGLGSPINQFDHQVDEVEIARWSNEVFAEYAALALTRIVRAEEVAADLYAKTSESTSPLSHEQSLKLAMVRLARRDLETAMAMASRPVDDLGAEEWPLGVERPPVRAAEESVEESPGPLATVTRLPIRLKPEPIWEIALRQREDEKAKRRQRVRFSKTPHRDKAAGSPPPPSQLPDAASSAVELTQGVSHGEEEEGRRRDVVVDGREPKACQ